MRSVDGASERSDAVAPEGFRVTPPGIDPIDARRRQTETHWRLAAILFIGGGLAAIPADALERPAHPATVYLLPLLAILSGAVCWALAGRLRRRWLHAMTLIATLEIALTVGFADRIFAAYYAFIAIYAAYVFTSRREIAGHIVFACLAAFAPVLYAPETARESLIQGLVIVQTLVLAGASVAYLREQLETSQSRYRDLSERDPLTGVGNYRMLVDRVPRELDRHRRHGESLALLVIDLDDFKRVNDAYGHQHGDEVLSAVALAIAGSVRAHDIVVRQGGDEFAVVAPQSDGDSVELLCARLRKAVAAVSCEGGSIGASVGCARFPEDGGTLEQLLAHADERLRAAKEVKDAVA